MEVCSWTTGSASPAFIICSTRRNFLPSLPPGCRLAKSSGLKPFSTSTVIASASPIARAAVVLAVGTRFIGQASSDTLQSSATSADCASVELTSPVRATSGAPMRFSVSSTRVSSSVSPLYDIAMTTSSAWMTPRSPCTASAGWRKNAGVPVLASVAAILRQMTPDLPMPVTMTRPLQLWISITARANLSSMRCSSARIAAASVWRTLRASVKSGMSGDLIKSDQPAQEHLEAIEAKSVGRIALGAGGLLMNFHEHAIHAGGDARLRHRLDVFGKAGADAVAPAGQLQAVRHVEHHGIAEAAQHRERARVDDEIVIAERRPALGDEHVAVA